MSVEEMDNMFEVLYNNITSNQAPGLNPYEKSVFLTKAQDEILKNYFNPKSKGNNLQEGFDDSQKRQIDFSMLTTVMTLEEPDVRNIYTKVQDDEGQDILDRNGKSVYKVSGKEEVPQPGAKVYTPALDKRYTLMKDDRGNQLYVEGDTFHGALFDMRDNSKSIELPAMMMAINEMVEVTRDLKKVLLQVVPIKFDEYSRLMSKPYKRPLKYQAWRLINSDVYNKADIVVGPSDRLTKYTIRYIRRPQPIIVGNLDGLTIEGVGIPTECELDPSLHEEILQRAVELAKMAWTATGQDNTQMVVQAGTRSE